MYDVTFMNIDIFQQKCYNDNWYVFYILLFYKNHIAMFLYLKYMQHFSSRLMYFNSDMDPGLATRR